MKNFVIIIACFSFLFACGSIGYYYGFYLPSKPSQEQFMIEQGYQSAKNQNITDSIRCNKIFDKEASIGCMKYANEVAQSYNNRFIQDLDYKNFLEKQIEKIFTEKTKLKTEIDKLNKQYTVETLLQAGEKIYGTKQITSDMLIYIFGTDEEIDIDFAYRVCVNDSDFTCNIKLPPSGDLYETYILQDSVIRIPQPHIDIYMSRLQDIISDYNNYKTGKISLKEISEKWNTHHNLQLQ